jgi:hypothetical protein
VAHSGDLAWTEGEVPAIRDFGKFEFTKQAFAADETRDSVDQPLARIYNRAMAEPQWTPESVARILMNPQYCLGQHPAVDEDTWIKANAKMIREMGAESYLATLLSLLRDHDA